MRQISTLIVAISLVIASMASAQETTGKIAGKVQYSEIEIEKGGEIEGTLSQDANGPVVNVGTPSAA